MRRAERKGTEPTQGKELIAHGGAQPATLPAPGQCPGPLEECHFALFLPVIKKAEN